MSTTSPNNTPPDKTGLDGAGPDIVAREVRLRPPKHRIEKRAVTWWILQSLALFVPLIGGLIVAYALWEPARKWIIVPLIGIVVWALVCTTVRPLWRYAVHRWETTDEAVYGLNGWIVREWRVAPISRIQTVDAVRGPIEQMLGLATLRVTTASSYGAISIEGLDKAVAEEAAERLTTIAQLTPGDAT
ncbi:PH domain-containing protein [Natronoglycomyces albus]|uniref:PH domain-containing protein n=1 Tax=Natronoglycomyces albus TaxID=2811108 RepID=A0A895XMU9_9ACTN|nr:PH domain-containing protein [Natronoglycomyces albus]QSB04355.1 PH domain-containing protein [Natronoglycomyces albus]